MTSKKFSTDNTTSIPPKPSNSPPSSSRLDTGQAIPGRCRSVFLRSAAAVFSLWFATLIVLAATTANPVVVNGLQVTRAEAVVTGVVTDLEQERVRVDREWKRAAQLKEITIRGLSQLPVQPGKTYIFPLKRLDGEVYQVMPLPPTAPGCPVYPLTRDIRSQLERILAAF